MVPRKIWLEEALYLGRKSFSSYHVLLKAALLQPRQRGGNCSGQMPSPTPEALIASPHLHPRRAGRRCFQSLSWVLTDCQLVQRQPTGTETFPGPVCCCLVDPKYLVCNYRSVYTRQEMENNTLPCSISKPESRTKADSSNKCFTEMKPLEEVDKSFF